MLILWGDTATVIKWFNLFKAEDSQDLHFLQFDIISYYPSISKDLLKKALKWAQQHYDIDQEDIDIILASRESFLFNMDKLHTKQGSTPNSHFDVPMGAWDSAEVCEIVGLYLLAKIKTVFGDNMFFGLYRDDGLALVKGSGPQLDRKRKQLTKIFKEAGLGIEAFNNIRTANFLDVTFDLDTMSHRPYKKPNSDTKYIHVKSDHPPSITKAVPKTVEKRLSMLSSNKEIFDQEKIEYEEALKMSGYKTKLEYQPYEKKKRVRKRTITYFNPPFSKCVKTNLGRQFLRLIDKHFPAGTKISRLMNRKCIKLSYCTMKNMQRHIDAHNRKILTEDKQEDDRLCNCRKPNECPLDGKCLTKGIVYQADVRADNKLMTYYGLTEHTFKKRYNEHQSDFRHEKHRNSTALSKHIHSLKDSKTDYEVTWKINSKAYPYQPGSKQCDLCLQEKLVICLADPKTTLNKRNEMVSKCRHKRKFVLQVACSKNQRKNPP